MKVDYGCLTESDPAGCLYPMALGEILHGLEENDESPQVRDLAYICLHHVIIEGDIFSWTLASPLSLCVSFWHEDHIVTWVTAIVVYAYS